MSVLSIDVKTQFPNSEPFTQPQIVASGAVGSINAGEPTKKGTAGAVADMANGDGTTSQVFTGIAKTTSTDTASVAGVVTTYVPYPGLVYACKALTASLANTAALIAALQYKRVKWSKVTQTFTVDTNQADATANGLLIMGGEPQTSTIWFNVVSTTSIFGQATT